MYKGEGRCCNVCRENDKMVEIHVVCLARHWIFVYNNDMKKTNVWG